MRAKKILSLLIVALLGMISFGTTPVASTIPRDYWPTDEWRLSTPEAQGMNSAILNMTSDYLEEDTTTIHSMIVIRNGYIVFEEYSALYHEDSRHIIFSCTKSITSTLIGIALEQGYINSVDDLILDYFQDYNITNPDARKELITLEHLLTMTAGFDWSEGGGDDDYFSMGFSDNWVEYVLSRPMIADPGETFEYSTGGSHLLSAILNISTGRTPLSFAEEYLFNPIGINDIYWPTDPQGINNGGSDLGITPRDMARFGYLILNNGTWDGEQIVPPEWIEEATSTKVAFNSETGYGYQWWTTPSMDLFSARGYHGQLIVVIPDYDIVVVTTADDPNTGTTLFQILSNYILPSVDSFISPVGEPLGITVVVITSVSIVTLIVILFLYRRR